MDFSYLDDWTDEEAGAEEIQEAGEGYRNVWVLAEMTGNGLSAGTLEAMGQARELADQIGVYVYGILVGEGGEDEGQALVSYGADKVLVVDDPVAAEYQPEVFGEALASLVNKYRPEILLIPVQRPDRRWRRSSLANFRSRMKTSTALATLRWSSWTWTAKLEV
jgi:electron transfer flavoprotein alpha subunit